MFDILAITVSIYVSIGLGYGLTRWGVFAKTDMRAFGTFVVKVAMPALLFNALSQRSLSDILNSEYVAAYALASLITLILSVTWALKVLKTTRSMSACMGLGMTCSNSGFVGYPISLLSLGPIAGVSLALNMIVENLIIIPLMLAWAETGSGQQRWHQIFIQTLKGMLKNPMIWGIVLGFAFSWFSIQLPASLSRAVTLFAQASARGYAWSATPAGMTTRPSLITPHPTRQMKLDWLGTRGLHLQDKAMIAALTPEGKPLSDHDAVWCRVQI